MESHDPTSHVGANLPGDQAHGVATRSASLLGRHHTETSAGAGRLRSVAAYRLSGALGVVALAASSTSFFIPGVLGGPVVSQGNLRGTTLVIMVLAVPALFSRCTFLKEVRSSASRLARSGGVHHLPGRAVSLRHPFQQPVSDLCRHAVARILVCSGAHAADRTDDVQCAIRWALASTRHCHLRGRLWQHSTRWCGCERSSPPCSATRRRRSWRVRA